MKKLIFGTLAVLSLFVFTYSVNSEVKTELDTVDKFKVINVQGRIVFKKTGNDMKRGDTYVTGTTLDFVNDKSRAAIINYKKGRFVLTGNTKGKVKVLPAANNISSRSGPIMNLVALKKHFEEKVLILDKAEVMVGKENFPMDENNFFYLTYEHKGEEIAKKLPYNRDRIVLNKSEIFMIDGEAIEYQEKEMTLYYRKNGKGSKVNVFTPVFPDLVDLKEEVSLILEMFEGETVERQKDEIIGHLKEFYGKPANIDNINDWLKDEFGL